MRNVFKKIFIWIFPELHIIKNKFYNFNYIMSYATNVKKGKNANFEQIYRLSNVVIDDETYIAHNSLISNTIIGKYSSIGPNVFCGWGIHPTNGITSCSKFYSTTDLNGKSFAKKDKIIERKEIIIGNDVFVGANVTILDGVKIGDGAFIGAGAVVSKDIPPYAVAVGSPIRIIRYRFTEEQINALLRIKWWNFDDEKIKDVENFFFDIDEFIKKYDV